MRLYHGSTVDISDIKGITFQYAFCTQQAIEKLKKVL